MRHLALLGALLTSLAGGSGAQTALPIPTFEGQVIYQVMPDRFFDGNPANNQGVNRDDPRAWHGGDLPGLTQKLAYIQKLGATSVWLTPVYQQQAANSFGTAGYHGYWPADFRNVDPHFGTLADFGTFVKAAQGAGMRVVLDQVINHYGYEAAAVRLRKDWFNTQATCDATQNKDVDCPLSGLPDLRQSNPQVRDLLLGNADFWREQGVNAFRYDAIKHVERPFLNDLLAADRQAGTWTLGEWFGADTGTVADWQKAGFDSLFLFSLQDAMKASVMGESSLDAVRQVLARQGELPRPGEVALFLDNHDVPRFAQGSLFEDVGQERTRYGLRALMTLRGVPVIWQGTEIAMRGGTDPDNRRDMRFEDQWTPAERAVFGATQAAIAARKASPALSSGAQTLLPTPDRVSGQLLLFTRELNGQTVLAAWHSGNARRTYSLKLSVLGVNWAALAATPSLFAGQDAKVSVSGGYLHLSLPARDAAAFRVQ
ncbi:alpha-amylase family glycosyl hydrolase [Deinococcus soli (ex Cha et al. 2016)]|uniref:Glycosidase n=2 Tax=Deinococcus soli (ex Cha et al. 2016) TaxID=1309411 RepID=A0ACC6KM77_9DEIO|nr:alpha-amylase family glycosyl hydrolase [Deinococcus soli (ex Cha et al. 2016)]MDR6220461.1 glycosidase [Deinococcus soli (ex Cha et al. 2016)]MDR6330208.1 glycosidase [Deinococcus soli (ex Cha et al. 2016)]MDR6753542.1 glycosidase [Deinococcus soli (ex Cha et al. 2016)]